MRRTAHLVILFTMIGMFLAACSGSKKESIVTEQATVDYDLLLSLPDHPISYQQTVKPVLEKRCVVCHGCYDAPCQLKLSSEEGVTRGASKVRVYDGARILPTEPTRLFVDARSTEEWRKKGFHSILNELSEAPEANLDDSVMYRMLRLKQLHPQPRVGMLPESFDLGLNRAQTCPTLEEFDDYARDHPAWGMPYALPNLQDEEYRVLVQWLAQGSPMEDARPPSPAAKQQIIRWERFLNGSSNKEKLVSRYLYEHLFHAHLHLGDSGPREFYRLVRSRTPSGTPVDEIATLRPYEDPGDNLHYRLIPYLPAIVAKDHVVYELNDRRMRRYRELFLEPDYQVSELPGHDPETASNPFKVFSPIPANSRYRFLLDDARFFIEGFIKGPVCRGQIALSVIEDHFWVMFFNPDQAIFTEDTEFLEHMTEDLQLPAARGDTLRLIGTWRSYWKRQKQYIAEKEAYFKKIHAVDLTEAMDIIWDGDGRNDNAALTVFRHFDSASVTNGLVGEYPETAWIIDYPLLERIHYLLVAGFNVYGNVGHQLLTRLFMDLLRMEGEDYFLTFLPADKRKEIRDSWYSGIREKLPEKFAAPMDWLQKDAVTGYRTDDPQLELYQHLLRRFSKLSNGRSDLDRCDDTGCTDTAYSNDKQRADHAMQKISRMEGELLHIFPDVSFVRIRTGEAPEQDLAYTVILNKAYKHVTSMLQDESTEDTRDYQYDSLTVVDWLEGSYPNFFFVIDLEEIELFTERYAAIRDRKDYEQFVARYGIRRTNQQFWQEADWFHDQYAREKPVLSGLFDLNRYQNR